MDRFLRAKDQDEMFFFLPPACVNEKKAQFRIRLLVCVCARARENDYLRVLRHPVGWVSLDGSKEKEGYVDGCVRGFVKQYRYHLTGAVRILL